MKNTLLFAALLLLMTAMPAFAQEKNLLVNGGFEEVGAFGEATGWQMDSGNLQVVEDPDKPGNMVLQSSRENPFQIIAATQRIKIDPKWKKVGVRARMKATKIVLGKESWQKPRVSLAWINADGEKIGFPPQPALNGDSTWKRFSIDFAVKQDAVYLEVIPGNFAEEGFAMFDDIEIIADPPLAATPITKAMPQGTFEPTKESPDAGWIFSDGASIIKQKDSHFLRLSVSKTGNATAEQRFLLDPEWIAVNVSVRMRAAGLVPGKEAWETARLIYTFQDKDGNRVGPWPPHIRLIKDSDWQAMERTVDIPKGARYLMVTPAIINCKGTADFDNLKVRGAVPE